MLVLCWFSVRDAGYEVRTWAPGGAILLALVALGAALLPVPWRTLPRSTAAAAALLAAYCAWSYGSIAWAADPGAAWLAANRTVVFLAVFVLLATWRLGAATAGLLLGAWISVVTVLAGIVAVRLLTDTDLRPLLPDGRLLFPAGYANATAALLTMAALGAVTLAAARTVPWWVRGGTAAAAVLLVDIALLAVSRGSALATPLTLAALLVCLPDRLRRLTALLPVAAGVALAGARLVHVTDTLGVYQPPDGVHDARSAGVAVVAGVALAAVLVGGLALLEHRRPPSPALAATLRGGGTAATAVAVAAALVGGLVVVGNPVHRLDRAWSSFKGGYTSYSGTRFGSGLGSNRYDFYRVALREFRDHPVRGAGADNFAEAYLRRGRSEETPRFPHSLELRTLSETGIIGTLLLFGAMGAALPAAVRAARSRADGALGRAVAAGALAAFVYWVVHGSADWFFEYAGLGAVAFGLLGLATGLDPARARSPRARRSRRGPALVLACAAVALPVAALLAQWAADREVAQAGAIFATRSGEAYDRLERARGLDPLADTPDTVAGSIAIRLGAPVRAQRSFERALRRSPNDQYAQLQLGAVQSALGMDAQAERSLRRAVALAPRDPVARDALTVVRDGGRIDVLALSARLSVRGASAG